MSQFGRWDDSALTDENQTENQREREREKKIDSKDAEILVFVCGSFSNRSPRKRLTWTDVWKTDLFC